MARGERIQPIETDGLKLMSMGFLLEPERAVIMRGPMLHGIMQQFLHQVDWGPLDYLVIDLPPGTGDVPLTLAQIAAPDRRRGRLHAAGGRAARRHPGRHHVPPAQGAGARDDREHELLRRRRPTSGSAAGPRPHQLIDAKGFFDTPGDERVYLFGRGGARRKAEQLGVPFLGEVPLNIFLRETRRRGQDRRRPCRRARRRGPISSASSSSSPPRSASRTSRRPRCRSWRSSAEEPMAQPGIGGLRVQAGRQWIASASRITGPRRQARAVRRPATRRTSDRREVPGLSHGPIG